jgi:hypothetical protein
MISGVFFVTGDLVVLRWAVSTFIVIATGISSTHLDGGLLFAADWG